MMYGGIYFSRQEPWGSGRAMLFVHHLAPTSVQLDQMRPSKGEGHGTTSFPSFTQGISGSRRLLS